MIRNINKNENNNFINDYIEYHFQKETKKFWKLKYNLTNTTSKKLSKIKSYNTIEPTNKQIFPYININQNQINSNSKKSNNNNNNYYSSIKISKRTLSNKNLDENVNALSNIKKDEVNVDNDNAIKESGPLFVEIFTDKEQVWEPKSSAKRLSDGTLVSPPLYDMEPFLPEDELKKNIL